LIEALIAKGMTGKLGLFGADDDSAKGQSFAFEI
jgi:hypothetical protein